ncbi:MAG: DUF4846 domain-containing protein [Candidatus Zixiibacteriota bacterium]
MKAVLVIGTLILGMAAGILGADTVKVQFPPEWYNSHYPYMTYQGDGFTFESEFLWPTGFQRISRKSLEPFQFWVSNIPLWHRDRIVGSPATGKVYDASAVSRPVHLVWRTLKFYDNTIPLQLLVEYFNSIKKLDDLPVRLLAGAPVTYRQFRSNDVAFDARGAVIWQPTKERPTSDSMVSAYMELIAANTTYLSLEQNCTPIADTVLLPGDLFISRDSLGLQGVVYSVLVTAVDKTGEHRYIVGTGCKGGCDFYIPLFSGGKNYPWVSRDEISALAKYPVSGFFRFSLLSKSGKGK